MREKHWIVVSLEPRARKYVDEYRQKINVGAVNKISIKALVMMALQEFMERHPTGEELKIARWPE